VKRERGGRVPLVFYDYLLIIDREEIGRMNYIKEMNALYDRQEQTPLTGSAISLWSALMNINNKTRWKNTFTSPGSVLRSKAGLTESSFKRARAELVRLGYIEVESQGRGKAPIYTMHSLVMGLDGDSVDGEKHERVVGRGAFEDRVGEKRLTGQRQEGVGVTEQVEASSKLGMDSSPVQRVNLGAVQVREQQEGDYPNQVTDELPIQQVDREVTHVPTHDANHLPDHEPAPLLKQYITEMKPKRNDTKTAAADARERVSSGTKIEDAGKEPDAIRFYQENFGMASPFVAESLMDWIQSLGEELVIEAMKRALERGKTSWGYVKSILNAWGKKGIRTVAQAEAEQVAFENERRQRSGQQRGRAGAFFAVKEDIVPDWYEVEKERQRKEREKKVVRDAGEMERVREKVEGLLREYV
jgi:DnaD/phage-associated family protein